jgi:hypothetical protein
MSSARWPGANGVSVPSLRVAGQVQVGDGPDAVVRPALSLPFIVKAPKVNRVLRHQGEPVASGVLEVLFVPSAEGTSRTRRLDAMPGVR